MQSKEDLKDFVISLLKDNLPENYSYHNHVHTLYVMQTAVEIGINEECTEKELELLSVAALWHDTGYIKTYKNHEEESCKLARHYLPGFGFSPDDIENVCGMIMATRIPQSPKNKLEEILADADLEYLGTKIFGSSADDLFRELRFVNPSLTQEQWIQTQILFLRKHQYFTRFCKENKAPVKMNYLEQLEQGVI